MNNLKAKLVILDAKHNPLTEQFLRKTLKELRIPPDQVYLTYLGKGIKDLVCTEEKLKEHFREEVKKIKPEVVLTLGKDPLYTLLFPLLKSNFKLSNYIGKLIKDEWKIVPSYDVNYIVNRTKKELDSFKGCFNVIRTELFGS